jgi:2-phosphoglycerate kinase
MFYLIGGVPRSGKTTLAKKLALKTGIPWVSTDTLESVVMGYVSPESLDNMFPKSLIRKQTNQSNDEMYTAYSSAQIVDAYLTQGKSLERAIEAFVECETKYKHEFILEGHHIHPEFVARLKERFELKAIFVGRDSVEKTVGAITQHANENDWVTTKTKNPETYQKIAGMLVNFSQYFRESAKVNGLTYISVEDNYNEKIEEVSTTLATN